jgi:phage repressor protein C with HTH and peptisase S24 domain
VDVRSIADPRQYLDELIRERREDYASLSRLIGRNPSYIQQFIKRGSPKRLDEEDRRTLARYFGVPEATLGAREDAKVPLRKIPTLEVRASAGHGAFSVPESSSDSMGFSERLLRELAGGDLAGLSMIKVVGDSMAPTLNDGDDIMVNRLDAAPRLRDGIYVIRMGDGLLVKRIAREVDRRLVTIISDNGAYPAWPGTSLKDIAVIGRVVWSGKRLR